MKKINAIFGILILVIAGFLIYNFTIGKAIVDNTCKGNNTVKLVLFYGQGCPHCAQLESFLENLQERECPYLEIKEYEVYFNQDNRLLWEKFSEVYNSEIQGVPTVYIGDKVIIGFTKTVGEQLKQEIYSCRENDCIDPEEKVSGETTQIIGNHSPTESPQIARFKKTLTIPLVIAAAAVDSINPCEFAVLILLLTTILLSADRKKALHAGLAFSLAIFISYFLMGLGLYSAIQASGLTRTFYIIVAFLAILVGLFNLKDYFWYGRWFRMEVPLSWRPKMKSFLSRVTSVPGAFIVGIIISLFLLPCTSGPYIIILGLLANLTTKTQGMIYLLLYNFIFILPMLTITLLIYFGLTTTEQAEHWRIKKLKTLHLITGMIILLLGIVMIISIILGWI